MEPVVYLLLFVSLIVDVISNTITPTEKQYRRHSVICDDGEDCIINCTSTDSCQYANIKCPENYGCTLSCTGDESCNSAILVALSVSSLNIICIQPEYQNYEPACYSMNITSTGTASYSSTPSAFANIECKSLSSNSNVYSSHYACDYSHFSLNNFNSITLSCSSSDSCQGIDLNTNMNNIININCNDVDSCKYAAMYINNTNTLSINAPYQSALRYATITIDGVYDTLKEINCDDKTVCQGTDFKFKNMNYAYGINNIHHVEMYCYWNSSYSSSYTNSGCRSMSLYVDSSYKFDLICDGKYGCYGVSVYGDCNSFWITCANDCDPSNINLDCNNNDNVFVFPPTRKPTRKPNGGNSSGHDDTFNYCTGSSSLSIIVTALLFIGLIVLLIIVSFASYSKYKTNDKINVNSNELIPQNTRLDRVDETERKENQQGGAIMMSSVQFTRSQPLLDHQTHDENQLNDANNDTYPSQWCQDIMIRKNCYFELLPHLMDHCFAIGVVLKFYNNALSCSGNYWSYFNCAIGIIIIYRFISCIQIFYYTKHIKQTIIQLFDMGFYQALIVNYSGDQNNKKDPRSPQKWISLMEAAFETVPMSILLMGYLASNSYFFSKYDGLLQIALFWCFVVLIIRNMNEDEICFKNAITQRLKARLREDNESTDEHILPSKYPWILLLRFGDTIARIYTLSFLGGITNIYIFIALVFVEFIVLLLYGHNRKKINDVVYHMFIRCDITDRLLVFERLIFNYIVLAVIVYYFYYLNNNSGTYMVYSVYFIGALNFGWYWLWKAIFYTEIVWYKEKNALYFNGINIFNQSRSINNLIERRLWKHVKLGGIGSIYTNPMKLYQQGNINKSEMENGFHLITSQIFTFISSERFQPHNL